MELIKCQLCGLEAEPSKKSTTTCVNCFKAIRARTSTLRKANDGWMDVSKQCELEIYERQPVETDTEWLLWCEYRNMYPHTKPIIKHAAERLDVSLSYAKETAMRWDWNIRIMAWKSMIDEHLTKERIEATVEMNRKHIGMAKKIQDKLEIAIDNIDPYNMAPKDITALMKMATDIERKAQLDETETYKASLLEGGKDTKAVVTKKEDMSDILAILSQAGILDNKQIGIEKTERIIIGGKE